MPSPPLLPHLAPLATLFLLRPEVSLPLSPPAATAVVRRANPERIFPPFPSPAISMLMQFLDGSRKRSIHSSHWRGRAKPAQPLARSRTSPLSPVSHFFFRAPPSPPQSLSYGHHRGDSFSLLRLGQFRRSLVHQVFFRREKSRPDLTDLPSTTGGELYLYSRYRREVSRFDPSVIRTTFSLALPPCTH